MRRVLKELALVAGGVGAGIALFLTIGSRADAFGFDYVAWGYPVAWNYGEDLARPNFSIFGTYLIMNWTGFAEDLLFWLGLSIIAVEGSSHIAVPYVLRKLKIQRVRRNTGQTTALELIQN
jgi:hypothetical protein